MAAQPALQLGIQEVYRARGAAAQLFRLNGGVNEIILSGPAGTGKSRAILEYLNWIAMDYPGCRLLMLRKTRRSLTESGMVTLENKVLHDAQGVRWNSTTQQYRYPNGAIIAVGGMDKPQKIMSSEWDIIYCQEATELNEEDWEAATTRLRNGVVPFQQIVGDCNPDAPTHWIKQRVSRGKSLMIESRHEDNPSVTEAYLNRLRELTGVRFERLYLGRWVAAEGMVHEGFDRRIHVIPRWPRTPDNPRGDPPKEWPRYLSIDFGFAHPFVCLWWAMDPDGRLYNYREIYWTNKLVEDHAADIKRHSGWDKKNGDPYPRLIICDHDAEGRATLERHLGMMTLNAHKNVTAGLQAVDARLRPSGDGRPRLFHLEGSLVAEDPNLKERRQPLCTVDEYESYVWARSTDGSFKEEPQKDYDHGQDACRYMVADRDLSSGIPKQGIKMF